MSVHLAVKFCIGAAGLKRLRSPEYDLAFAWLSVPDGEGTV